MALFIAIANDYLVYICSLNLDYDFKQHFFNFYARWQRMDTYYHCSIINVWR